jgi:hypothetical protein
MPKINPSTSKHNSKLIKSYQVIIPIILGLFVIGWLFIDEFDTSVFSTFHFTYLSILFLMLAFLLMLTRDLGMMSRFRLLTNNDLSWKQAFYINTLSEFTTAVTPAIVGGSSLVLVFLIKEGISAGRSAAIMFINLFLDELFFIVFCPILFLFVPINQLFNSSSIIVSTFGVVFVTLYVIRLFWISILYIGTFRRPLWIKGIMMTIFKLPVLKRWQSKVDALTNNMVETSHEISNRSFLFWAKAFGLTILSWTARFLVVNAIFMAFVPISNHLVVFVRQIVLWIVLVVSPTPGGSGVSEYAFKEYYSDIFKSQSIIILITLIWRIISYYFYLFLGVLVIPNWIKKSFGKNNLENA